MQLNVSYSKSFFVWSYTRRRWKKSFKPPIRRYLTKNSILKAFQWTQLRFFSFFSIKNNFSNYMKADSPQVLPVLSQHDHIFQKILNFATFPISKANYEVISLKYPKSNTSFNVESFLTEKKVVVMMSLICLIWIVLTLISFGNMRINILTINLYSNAAVQEVPKEFCWVWLIFVWVRGSQVELKVS